MSRRRYTKWPHPPDPRPGHFGARGYDPPYALPWKILVEGIPPNTTPYSYFTKPVVVEFFLEDVGGIEFNYRYGVVVPTRHAVVINSLNEPYATTNGWSVQYHVSVTLNSPGYFSRLSGRLDEMWPAGHWSTKIITGLADDLGSTYSDQVRLTAVPWDTPTGFV